MLESFVEGGKDSIGWDLVHVFQWGMLIWEDPSWSMGQVIQEKIGHHLNINNVLSQAIITQI